MTKNLRLRRALSVSVLAVAAMSLTGCMKLDMDIQVSSDNTMSGTVIFAVDKQVADLAGDELSEEDLSGGFADLESGTSEEKAYDDGTYVGTQVDFKDADIEELSTGGEGDPETLAIERVGDEFRVSGVMDLTDDGGEAEGFDPSSFTNASFKIRMSFPGDVVSSTGEISGNTVTWTPEFGEKTEITAVAKATDEGASPIKTIAIAGLVLLAALVAGGVFLVMRRSGGSGGAPTPITDGMPAAPAADGTPAAQSVEGAPDAGTSSYDVVGSGPERPSE